jgi:hypothetical protein
MAGSESSNGSNSKSIVMLLVSGINAHFSSTSFLHQANEASIINKAREMRIMFIFCCEDVKNQNRYKIANTV